MSSLPKSEFFSRLLGFQNHQTLARFAVFASFAVKCFGLIEVVSIQERDMKPRMAWVLGDRVYVVNNGQIEFEGAAQTIIDDHALRQKLLGV